MSREKKKVEQEVSEGAPAYIVTFSDMVTLLITFFVLLLSMANTQDEAKFNQGQESVKRALASVGFEGILTGKKINAIYKNKKIKHAVDENKDNPNDPVIYKTNEDSKNPIYKIQEMMTVMPSNIVGSDPSFNPMTITFPKRKFKLDKKNTEEIVNYCEDLTSNLSENNTTIYIIGLSKDYNSLEKNLILSAQRANQVCKIIKEQLAENPYWKVYYWGAGPGGDWTSKDGIISQDTQIAIGILTAN